MFDKNFFFSILPLDKKEKPHPLPSILKNPFLHEDINIIKNIKGSWQMICLHYEFTALNIELFMLSRVLKFQAAVHRFEVTILLLIAYNNSLWAAFMSSLGDRDRYRWIPLSCWLASLLNPQTTSPVRDVVSNNNKVESKWRR